MAPLAHPLRFLCSNVGGTCGREFLRKCSYSSTTSQAKKLLIKGGSHKLTIPNIAKLVEGHFEAELSCFMNRFGLKQNDERRIATVFIDASLNEPVDNSLASVQGYFLLREIVSWLLMLHYKNLLPSMLLEPFVEFLVHRNHVSELAVRIGMAELIQSMVKPPFRDPMDTTPTEEDLKDDFHHFHLSRKIDTHDTLSSAFYALIFHVYEVNGTKKAREMVDNLVIPQLEGFNYAPINDTALTYALQAILTSLGQSPPRFVHTHTLNENLVGIKPDHTVRVMSGQKLIAEHSHHMVTTAFRSSKIQALSQILNSLYVDVISY